jgi:hypothetical protein
MRVSAREHGPHPPRNVLCVVVVTTSACTNGLAAHPAATRPDTCAMSTMSKAPTLSAISLNLA